ncbi:MAG TPA: TasA family protein [Symbiobacteriaceae bacterium]|nr:TasA family protein [Symbiobacteriaceae bacterium]
MMFKRLSLSLMAVAVVALLVSAASFALFTADASNENNTFTAGTVTLTNDTTFHIDIDNLAPGDAGDAGTWNVTYTGSLNAWLGIKAVASGDLMTCDGGGRFTITVSDGTNTYAVNDLNYQVMGMFSQGDPVGINVDYSFALAAGNDCQGDSASLDLYVHAVQSDNNTNATNDGPQDWN